MRILGKICADVTVFAPDTRRYIGRPGAIDLEHVVMVVEYDEGWYEVTLVTGLTRGFFPRDGASDAALRNAFALDTRPFKPYEKGGE